MKGRIKFIKSGITLTAVGLAMRTVSMLFGAFVTRTVGAEGMGIYTVVMTVYSFAITFATSGISLTVTRLVAGAVGEGREDEIGAILLSSVLYSLLFGFASTAVLFLGADFIGGVILADARTVSSLKILSLSLTGVGLCSVFSGYFIGVKRVGFNATVQVVSQIVKIALTLLLVIRASGYGVVSLVSALCLGITVTELLAFLFMLAEYLVDRHYHSTRVTKNKSNGLKKVAGAALPLAVSAYFRSILTTIEHILIPRRLISRGESGSQAYSNYGLLHGMALPVVLYPMSPLTSFSGLLVPEFAEDCAGGKKERMTKVASEALNTTLKYSAVIAVLMCFFSEELGYAVYGSYDAGRYIAMLAPIIPIMYLDHVTDSVLKGIGEQVYSMWVNIADSLLSVLLVYFLIPVFGIAGYALVIIIMEGFNFIMSVTRLYGRVRFKISIFSGLVLPLVISVIAAVITHSLFNFSGSTTPAVWLALKMVFTLSVIVSLLSFSHALFRSLSDKINAHLPFNAKKSAQFYHLCQKNEEMQITCQKTRGKHG